MKRAGTVGITGQNWLVAFGGRRPPYYALAAVCALAAVDGCTRAAYEYDAVVTGTVTIDGELAKSGTIAFHPVKTGRPAIGRIFSDGSYSLRTGQGDMAKEDGGTVASGEYLVTVSITGPAADGAVVGEGGPPKPGPVLIDKEPQKDTTDLHYIVKPGPQVIVLELKRSEPEAAAGEAAKPAEETDKKAAAPGEGGAPSATRATENATAEPKK